MRFRFLLHLTLALSLAGCASDAEPDAASVPLEFTGLEHVEADELRSAARIEIAAFEQEGRSVADLADATYAMETFLHEEGFPRAFVAFEVEPDESHPERVIFMIDEGPRTTIEGPVELPGCSQFALEEVRGLFQRTTGIFGAELDDTYRARDIESGRSRLETLYLDEGYVKVEIGEPELDWNEDDTRVSVTIPVREGPRFRVESVEVGGEIPDGIDLTRALADSRGQLYRLRSGTTAASAVRRRLAARGYLEAQVDAESELDDAEGKAHIRLTVKPGVRTRLVDIEVSGLDRTELDFVLDVIEGDLERGATLSEPDLGRVRNRLFGSGLFGDARLEPRYLDTDAPGSDPHDAILDVTLEEIEARSVAFEVGYGSYELARGRVRYTDRNLFGYGRELDVEARASIRSYGLETRVIDPWLLGPNDVLEAGVAFDFRQEPSFDRTRLAVDLTWRHRIDDRTTLRSGYSFELERADDVNAALAGSEEATALSAGLFSRVRHDGRDDPFAPTRGVLVEGGALWSSPALGANLSFVELSGAVSTYVELTEGTVIAVGARVTTRPILDDRGTLPIQERLFLGGDASVRSFFEDELGPTDASGDPVGGLTSLVAHVELRQVLIGDLHGAIFYDIGTVGEESFDFDGPYGHAIGAGLRYLLPIGPVRLDVGYNPGQRFAANQNWAIHFSFGFSF